MRPLALRSGFLVKPVGDQIVVFDQSRQHLHVLSQTTALVWRHCDGRHTVTELVEQVGRELGAPVDESLITVALAQLEEARLLENPIGAGSGDRTVTRRDLLHMAGALAAGIMLPTITSCGVPTEPASTAKAASFLASVDNTTTTSTSATTPLNTTTSTTGTTPLFTTTTSTTGTTPLFTTTTSTTPIFTTTTSTTPIFTTTTSTTPIFTTTTSTTSPPTTTTTTPAPKKVAMCHQGRTIMVDQDAVAAHLAHGDKIGRCP